jgi:hypothetical protein
MTATLVRESFDGIRFSPGDILSVPIGCAPLTLVSGGFTVVAANTRDLQKVLPIQSGPTSADEWQAALIGTARTIDVVELHTFAVCAVP